LRVISRQEKEGKGEERKERDGRDRKKHSRINFWL